VACAGFAGLPPEWRLGQMKQRGVDAWNSYRIEKRSVVTAFQLRNSIRAGSVAVKTILQEMQNNGDIPTK
jgi:hypothetical protein